MCSIVKYSLFVVNLIFTLAGITILGLGIAALLQLTDFFQLIEDNINAVPIALIVLGSVTFFIAFFGCCGAIKENRCLLIAYGVCMLLLAAGKIFIAVLLLGKVNELKDNVMEWLEIAFQDLQLREQYHAMEEAFSCCGTVGHASYPLSGIPPSCCEESVCTVSNSFDGCYKLVGNFIEQYAEILGIVIVVIIAVEFVAMILSFALCCNIRSKRTQTA